MIKKYFLHLAIFICLLLHISVYGQGYNIEAFQSTYDSLVDYNSRIVEADGDVFFWDPFFELPFEITWFDSSYSEIICDELANCFFVNELGISMHLFAFGYEVDEPDDLSIPLRSLTYIWVSMIF